MQHPTYTKTKSLQGITDLTVVAPVKQGLIDALDVRTYASRLRMLLGSLNAVRVSSEYATMQPFSDMVQRIQSIHNFRLAIVGEPGQEKLVLAVTFDSAWEPYMRLIWRDLGPLLDVIFCNCEGYPISRDNSFASYSAWVRSAQVRTEFFYTDSAFTVVDLQYLRQAERLAREAPVTRGSDLDAARLVADDPEAAAVRTFNGNLPDALEQGIGALTALYRLADMYPPDTPDGDLLLRAAHMGLKELRARDTKSMFPPQHPVRESFGPQLEWFERVPAERSVADAGTPAPDPRNLQGGILTGYDATHGALLLFGFDDGAAARAFLTGLLERGEITVEGDRPSTNATLNVAFTLEGLRKLGLSEADLAAFPQEFREGMEARAGVLGDLRSNHPRNWTLPERNWDSRHFGSNARVQLSMVDMVVQLYARASATPGDHAIVDNPSHPLHASIVQLASHPGARLLSVQALCRTIDPARNKPRDHFGFIDGISQPQLESDRPSGVWTNKVRWGEVFLGHPNDSGDPSTDRPLFVDGTFLVVRKLRQDVAVLDEALERGSRVSGLSTDELKAKMMGRTVDGEPLAAPGEPLGNAFDYSEDKDGGLCPLQAHIRRTNPRTAAKPIVPRIVRRGMSYGPRYDRSQPSADERGIVFMAYNASIAEQFEVIQRWVSGGNSTGIFSGHGDPLLGVPQPGDPRTFRFQHGGSVMRIDLDGPAARPFVRLEWGAYLFVPSIPALRLLSETVPQPSAPWSARDGEKIIQTLLWMEKNEVPGVADRWKELLEDILSRSFNVAASVWAAIRELHGGVLSTSYGVLVASDDLVRKVFADREGNYSVKGYADRMHRSFGLIYLGLDEGPAYTEQSSDVNAALMRVTEEEAFNLARQHTHALLDGVIGAAKERARAKHQARWSTTLDMKDVSDGVLAGLCNAWFGMPDANGRVLPGGFQWNWKSSEPPRCPAHFNAPSRYMFQPHPGAKASEYGEQHGRALKEAVLAFVLDQRASGAANLPALGRAIFDAFPNRADDALLASTFIGVFMGFIPTVDGNLRSCLYEWINDRRLWDLQEIFVSDPEQNVFARAVKVLKDPLRRTMQLRPIPEVVWRTAVKPHRLGDVDVEPGRIVVNAIVSATQELLGTNTTDVEPIFGGNRRNATHHTHACPAYPMGMGVLLGIVTALIEMGPVWPGPAPLTLTWSGDT